MIWIFVAFIVGIGLGYFIKQHFIRIEASSLKKQLHTISDEQFNQAELSLKMGSSELSSLLHELNDLLEKQRVVLKEQQVHENQLLEDIANISHDLRTPLTAIYGYLELLEQPELSVSEREIYLNIALSKTEVLQHLIQDLFYLTRLNVQKIPLDKEFIPLDQLLKEQIASFYQPLKEQEILLEVDFARIPEVETDKNAASRIFNNLLTNITEHGKSFAKIAVYEQDKQVVTQFSNHFIPSADFNLEDIFDRHYMGNKERNTKNSGLGLTITKELVSQLGHEIQADLEDDLFTITVIW